MAKCWGGIANHTRAAQWDIGYISPILSRPHGGTLATNPCCVGPQNGISAAGAWPHSRMLAMHPVHYRVGGTKWNLVRLWLRTPYCIRAIKGILARQGILYSLPCWGHKVESQLRIPCHAWATHSNLGGVFPVTARTGKCMGTAVCSVPYWHWASTHQFRVHENRDH